MAEKRLRLLKSKLQKDSRYKNDYFEFMNKIIAANDAEIAPPVECENGGRWYMPYFGIYHPKKGKIRVVFDCAAKYKDTSLNDHLLQGPDFINVAASRVVCL